MSEEVTSTSESTAGPCQYDLEKGEGVTQTQGAADPDVDAQYGLEKGEGVTQTQGAADPGVDAPNVRRQSQLWRALRSRILTWWLLCSHILISTAIVVVMLHFLQGYMAVDDAAGSIWEFRELGYRLRVGDVTTIISAVLVLNKFVVSAWTALTIWRCSYILMEEKQGIKISRLSRMLHWRVPTERPVGRVGWMVTLVLLLLFPQPLIGPLITGAVGWSTAVEYTNYTQVHTSERPPESFASWIVEDQGISDEAADEYDWSLLVMDTANLHDNSGIGPNGSQPMSFVATRAAGLTSILFDPEGNIDPELRTSKYYKNPCRQRVAPSERGLSLRSKAYKVEMPCILVEEITWTQVPQPLLNITAFDAWFNVSMFHMGLLASQVSGIAILFDPDSLRLIDRWHKETESGLIQFPKPATVSETLTLAVLLDMSNSSCDLGKMENTTKFGSFAGSGLSQSTIKVDGNKCYGYAEVSVTAGLVLFEEVEFVLSDVFEGKMDTSLTHADFKPDRWAHPSLMMLPDVMLQVAISNTSRMPTWNDLNLYIETLITQSYLGTWGELRSMEANHSEINVHIAATRLQAQIQQWRVLTWYIINLFVPVSGIIWYFGAQRSSKRAIIRDPIVDVLLADASRDLELARRLNNAVVEVTDQTSHYRRVGRLRLRNRNGVYGLEIFLPGPEQDLGDNSGEGNDTVGNTVGEHGVGIQDGSEQLEVLSGQVIIDE